MTHEELIERVAESIAGIAPLEKMHGAMQKTYRDQAREAIRITGEACVESAGVVEDYHRKEVAEAGDNEVMMARYNAQLAAGVVKNRILSLTQGTKE